VNFPHNHLSPVELQGAILPDPLTVSPDTTVQEAIALMGETYAHCSTHEPTKQSLQLKAKASCVLVVVENRVVGILTERDVVRLSAQQQSLTHLTVAAVMTQPVMTHRLSDFTNLFTIIERFKQEQICHLPIVDDGDRLLGLITHVSLWQQSSTHLLRLRFVGEMMTRPVLTAGPDCSMLEIARLMAEHQANVVVMTVPGGSVDAPFERAVGLLTQWDLVQFQALGLNLAQTMARKVMSAPVFTIGLEASLWAVQQLMDQHRIRQVIVVGKQGELLGIITQSSILKVFNPLELYTLAESLEKQVMCLEAERISLFDMRAAELERQVQERTAMIQIQAERDRLMAGLAAQILASLDVSVILDRTVRQVRKILGCDRVNIWRFEADWATVVVAESTHSDVSLIGERIHDTYFQETQGAVYRNGRIRVVPDIYTTEMSDCHREMLIRLQTRAKILVPLCCGDQLWGLLNVTETQPRNWQPTEVEFLRSLSMQLAIALQQAIQHQQLQAEMRDRQQAELELAQLNADLKARVSDRTAALTAREARYQALMEGASDAILLANPKGYIIEVNEKAALLLGYKRHQLVGMHVTQLHPAETLAIVAEAFEALASGERFQVVNLDILRQDGERVPVDISGSVIEVGGETIIQGVFHDVRERLRAEQEIKTENAFRQLILENLGEGLCVCHACPDYPFVEFTVWNPQMEVLTGYTQAEINQLGWYQTLYPDPEVQAQAIARMAAMRQGDHIQSEEWTIRHRDGSNRILAIATSLLQTAEGETNVLAVMQDVTERHQAEQTMRQQAEREILLREITQRIRESLDLQTIFNTACDEIRACLRADRVGIFQFKPDSGHQDGEFLAESVVNGFPSVRGICVHDRCFGENYADLYAQGRYYVVDDLYHHGLTPCHTDILAQFQVRANLVMPLLCNQELWGLLCIHQCHGPRHWHRAEIDLGHQLANQLAIAIQQALLYEQLQIELQERQRAEALITERNEELLRATRLKDEFLANMSHELRTPLNAILGMTEGLQDQVFGGINGLQLKALQTIERAGSHLLALINDILDVAKIEAGQVELECAPTAIAPLCQSSLTFVRQQALKKQIQLAVHVPDLPDIILDERRIRQVLINVLNNAVKFTPDKGQVTLNVMVIPPQDLEQQKPLLRFAIQDTGIGISADNIQNLFQPFMQIDSALNRQYQGTGLGLALTKRITELHGGQVSLTSELGVGSCFMIDIPYQAAVVLPQGQQNQLEAGLTVSDPLMRSEPLPQALLLLVEDNEANISTISSYLMAKGYRIEVARDGQEAIDQAVALSPDLILMDVQMPGMNGLEAMQRIREIELLATTPIIALTALAMESDRDRCLAAGANEYLSKPVRLKELAQLIPQLIQGSSKFKAIS